MRIRRRPQPFLQQASDPSTSTAPQTAQNAESIDDGGKEEGRLHADADLEEHKSGVARRLALPQDNAVDCGRSVGARQSADGFHMRCGAANGHHSTDQKDGGVKCNGAAASKPEPAAAAKVEERASNGALLPVAPRAVAMAVKDCEKASNGGAGAGGKRRRGPAVLLEGSRCSRVNGRGWRCSQPTLIGYLLCEHHLGKGRMRAAGVRGGAGRLGRTEHTARVQAGAVGGTGKLGRTEHTARVQADAVGAVTVAVAPDAEGPSPPGCY